MKHLWLQAFYIHYLITQTFLWWLNMQLTKTHLAIEHWLWFHIAIELQLPFGYLEFSFLMTRILQSNQNIFYLQKHITNEKLHYIEMIINTYIINVMMYFSGRYMMQLTTTMWRLLACSCPMEQTQWLPPTLGELLWRLRAQPKCLVYSMVSNC